MHVQRKGAQEVCPVAFSEKMAVIYSNLDMSGVDATDTWRRIREHNQYHGLIPPMLGHSLPSPCSHLNIPLIDIGHLPHRKRKKNLRVGPRLPIRLHPSQLTMITRLPPSLYLQWTQPTFEKFEPLACPQETHCINCI